jgi:hypothetical protein
MFIVSVSNPTCQIYPARTGRGTYEVLAPASSNCSTVD